MVHVQNTGARRTSSSNNDGCKRLIWINEFKKNGYHRKALIERANDGEQFI